MSDLTDLLIDDETVAELQARPGKARRKRVGVFEPGFVVVPAAWREALLTCKYRDTRNIAWGLLERAARVTYRGGKLYLPVWEAALTGAPRDGRRAALRELRDLGLIELQRELGGSFAIVLLRMG